MNESVSATIPSVFVMMSTYNGETYLKEQLDSILNQNDVAVTLSIRDDGSTDQTPKLLQEYANSHANIQLLLGDNLGYIKSFWTLLQNAEEGYDYYAFSDQDDVWLSDKLIHGIIELRTSNNNLSLFASGLTVTDENLNVLYENKFPKRKSSLGAVLTRPRMSGCTMIFSADLLSLCKKLPLERMKQPCVGHDTAVYLACLACGGDFLFSEESDIMFRRHETAVTVHGKGLLKKIMTVLDIFTTRRDETYTQAKLIRHYLFDHLTKESLAYLNQLLHYRKNFPNTVRFYFDSRRKCGLRSVDFIDGLAILLRRY